MDAIVLKLCANSHKGGHMPVADPFVMDPRARVDSWIKMIQMANLKGIEAISETAM
jgi:hypothetical protein